MIPNEDSNGETAPPVAALIRLLTRGRAVVLTGAGCSTASGIPDYGGLRSRLRGSRVQYRDFVDHEFARTRYWTRSMIGWSRVANAVPNAAHFAVASLEEIGAISGVITQNVDGLHQRAGNRRVVELHGSLSMVRCLECGTTESRAHVQRRLRALNPEFDGTVTAMEPDGDADITSPLRGFRSPDCASCGGVIKPDVVFFGETVPKPRVAQAWQLYDEADFLLVAGSSLAVFSGYRFALRAKQDGRTIAIINVGETRGDSFARVCIRHNVEAVLPKVADALRDRAHHDPDLPGVPGNERPGTNPLALGHRRW